MYLKIKDYLFRKRLNTAPLRRADAICLTQAGKMEFGRVRNEGVNLYSSYSGKQRGMEENEERTVIGWKATKEKNCERLSPEEKLLPAGRWQKWKVEVVAVGGPSPTSPAAAGGRPGFPLLCSYPSFKITFNVIPNAPSFKNDSQER